MITVYQRCVALDCADCVTTTIAGEFTAKKAYEVFGAALDLKEIRVYVESVEPNGTFKVWAYPDDFQDFIDGCIREAKAFILKKVDRGEVLPQFVKPKRKRIQR